MGLLDLRQNSKYIIYPLNILISIIFFKQIKSSFFHQYPLILIGRATVQLHVPIYFPILLTFRYNLKFLFYNTQNFFVTILNLQTSHE